MRNSGIRALAVVVTFLSAFPASGDATKVLELCASAVRDVMREPDSPLGRNYLSDRYPGETDFLIARIKEGRFCDAVDYYREKLGDGFLDAGTNLGYMHYYGMCGLSRASDAEFYRANPDDSDSLYSRAYILVRESRRDKSKAANGMTLLEEASEKGSVNATTRLGYEYLRGNIIQTDLEKAFEYLTKSQKLGDPTAYFYIAIMFFYYSDEIDFTDTESFDPEQLAREALERGEVSAANLLSAINYQNGDYVSAIYYAHIAAAFLVTGSAESRKRASDRVTVEQNEGARQRAQRFVEDRSIQLCFEQTAGINGPDEKQSLIAFEQFFRLMPIEFWSERD